MTSVRTCSHESELMQVLPSPSSRPAKKLTCFTPELHGTLTGTWRCCRRKCSRSWGCCGPSCCPTPMRSAMCSSYSDPQARLAVASLHFCLLMPVPSKSLYCQLNSEPKRERDSGKCSSSFVKLTWYKIIIDHPCSPAMYTPLLTILNFSIKIRVGMKRTA